jgi:hypothetical protein
MIAENWEVWFRKVKVNEWHVSWPANEKRYEDIYCRWNIAGVATLCDGNAMLLKSNSLRGLKGYRF